MLHVYRDLSIGLSSCSVVIVWEGVYVCPCARVFVCVYSACVCMIRMLLGAYDSWNVVILETNGLIDWVWCLHKIIRICT